MNNNAISFVEEDKEFYPTPSDLGYKMLNGVDFEMVSSVLEPSAGKGDLADIICKKLKLAHWRRDEKSNELIDCIEIDSNLRMILSGKKYPVVHDDFLTYRTHKQYDLIVMNPPFSNGDLHLLKALELIKDGGTAVCLLNAETLRNRCANSRKLLWDKLNEHEAKIQYINNAFSNAERNTDVTIALIRITIPQVEHESFIFNDLKKKSYEEIDIECTDLVSGDYIAQTIKQYEMEIDAGIRLINEYRAMLPYIRKEFSEKNDSLPTLDMKINGKGEYSSDRLSVNEYVGIVRLKYWDALFHNKKFTGMLTSNLQTDLYKKVQSLVNYDFSAYNIKQIQDEIFHLVSKGVEDTILSLFDKLSAEHSWYPEMQNNIHYYNGWATNKAHKINKKVIIPINGAFSNYSWKTEAFEVYPVYNIMRDIEKTLSYLDTGSTAVEDDLDQRLTTCAKNGRTKGISLRYFEITLYKKGTCHIVFTNMGLLEKLNIYGSQKKGWLPPCYGKKHYGDMNTSEKTTVDEFQGSDAYEKVMARADYYLAEVMGKSPLMLPGV